MENGMDRASQPSGNEQVSPPEGELSASLVSLLGQPIPPRQKPGHPLTTRKGILFSGLALLIIVASLGASLLALKILAKPGPSKKWSFQPEGYDGITFSPIIANGMVYALFGGRGIFDNSSLYALDAFSGNQKWSHRLDGFFPVPPILANDVIYVVSDDLAAENSTVYALDALSGREKWSYQTESSISFVSPPTVANGMIYLLSKDGTLDALDAVSGHQRWNEQMGDQATSRPIVANGMVYVATSDDSAKDSAVYALDAVSGRQKWSYRETAILTLEPTAANGMVYVISDDAVADTSTVYALNAVSGHKKWSYQLGSYLFLSILLVSNGMIYVDVIFQDDTSNATLYALDALSGRQRWTTQMVHYVPTIVNGIVYIFSGNRNLYALDAPSGHKKWSYKINSADYDVLSVPAPTVVNGMIYVGTIDGMLYALDAASGREKWSYQPGTLMVSPVVADGIVYVGSIDGNLYAIGI